MAVILVGQLEWGGSRFMHGTAHAARPLQISFPGYTSAELISVRLAASTKLKLPPKGQYINVLVDGGIAARRLNKT